MNKKAFTIIEIIVVLIIIGIIAGFTIPNYKKSIYLARERESRNNLIMIWDALQLYTGKFDGFIDSGAGTLDYVDIYRDLNLNMTVGEITYTYQGDATTFDVTAELQDSGGSTIFELTIDENKLDFDGSDQNPCCSGGNCQAVTDSC